MSALLNQTLRPEREASSIQAGFSKVLQIFPAVGTGIGVQKFQCSIFLRTSQYPTCCELHGASQLDL